MGDVLDHQGALERWQHEPMTFMSEILRNPATGRPFELLPAQIEFFKHAFQTNDEGYSRYSEQTYGAKKKSGKTGTGALHVLTTTLVFGGRYAESFIAANDLEQAQSRGFEAIRRIVQASPLLKREAVITQSRITFPATGATITAIASDYAGAAGGHPTISWFDELWAYNTESSRRLFDEMCSVPTRKFSVRLTTSYAGWEQESETLEQQCKHGLAQPIIGPDLRAGDGHLFFWTSRAIAPWQDERWHTQMRSQLRPNQYLRMIENKFVPSDGDSFCDMDHFDQCVDPNVRPIIADKGLAVWVGVDASVKRDSTGIAVCAFDKDTKRVRLVRHHIFQPTAREHIDFEEHIEETLLDINKRFSVRSVYYDPYMMQASAQRIRKCGVPMVEFAQSVPNLTAASQNLYELIKARGIQLYRDNDIRLAAQRAIAVETVRGWRIAKERQSHKIDIVVALAQSALACIRQSQMRQPMDVHLSPPTVLYPSGDRAATRWGI